MVSGWSQIQIGKLDEANSMRLFSFHPFDRKRVRPVDPGRALVASLGLSFLRREAMPRKHKAFGIVRREIAKKIRQHKRAHRMAKRKTHRLKLSLAIRELETMQQQLAMTWNSKTCPKLS
jgi:hypothetical protein